MTGDALRKRRANPSPARAPGHRPSAPPAGPAARPEPATGRAGTGDEGLERALGGSGAITLAGLALLALLGGGGFWLAHAPIESATILPGSLALAHPAPVIEVQETGRVAVLHVREGERVVSGQKLLSLDPVALDAEIALLALQRDEVAARHARLLAEQAGSARTNETVAGPAAKRQVNLQAARATLRAADAMRAETIVAAARRQLDALAAQQASVGAQHRLVIEELTAQETLAARGLGDRTRLLGLRREGARLDGLAADLAGKRADLEGTIDQTRATEARALAQWRADIAAERADLAYRLADVEARILALRETRARLTLRAPLSGHVFALAVSGQGATVRPGMALMQLMPEEPDLIIRARVAPDLAHRLEAGQAARLRFVSLDGPASPELEARLLRLGPETGEGAVGGAYLADLAPLPGALASSLPRAALRPGLPVEVHVAGPRQSALAWLVKPLADFMGTALREP